MRRRSVNFLYLLGEVIGITTAIVTDSDGLGFAVSSDTILNVLRTILA